eukprot:4398703-Heterocapsa_arctica.AAC.1
MSAVGGVGKRDRGGPPPGCGVGASAWLLEQSPPARQSSQREESIRQAPGVSVGDSRPSGSPSGVACAWPWPSVSPPSSPSGMESR